MKGLRDFLLLHLIILLFSFTGLLTKFASIFLNEGGITDIRVYVCLFLMFLNCALYAVFWQMIIKKFDLSFAFANRSVYLIWSQIWAVLVFKESLTVRNVIGMIIVLIGVTVVQLSDAKESKEEGKEIQ